MKKLPNILSIDTVASSRLFNIEAVKLRFGNGVETNYERIAAGKQCGGAILIVPVSAEGSILLVREYAVGLERYELGPPKGLIEHGETAVEAANRELMEEIGVEAQNLRSLGVLSVAPGFFSFTTEVFLATELSCKQMVGDEPEPLEVVHLPLNQLDQTIVSGQISEARSVAALYLVRCLLNTTT